MKRDFCEYCNTPLPEHEKPITVYRHKGERHFLFQNVPARVCIRCGERYFGAQAARQMDRLMRTRAKPRKTLSVPVINLSIFAMLKFTACIMVSV